MRRRGDNKTGKEEGKQQRIIMRVRGMTGRMMDGGRDRKDEGREGWSEAKGSEARDREQNRREGEMHPRKK